MNFDMLASAKACLAAPNTIVLKADFSQVWVFGGEKGGGGDGGDLKKKKNPQNFDTESIANPGANDVR